MKRSFSMLVSGSLCLAVFVGCGGHEGGQLEIPADNPFQVSPAEEAARLKQRSAAFEARMAAEQAAAEAAAQEQAVEEPAPPAPTPQAQPRAKTPSATAGNSRYAQ